MIAILPEIIIALGAIKLLVFKNKFEELDSKKVFYIAKGYLLSSFLIALFLYNNKIFSPILEISPRLMLLKTIIYTYSIIWFYLSARWFANKNENGANFAIMALLYIISILLLISVRNLYAIATILTIITVINHKMFQLRKHAEQIICDIKTYNKTATALLSLFWVGIIIINSYPLISILLMVPVILFLVGAAPFHNGFINIVGKSILPVSGLCATINTIGSVLIFHILMRDTFANNREVATNILTIIGLTSIFIGAIYATMQTNLRKVLAYTSTFNVGVVLLILSSFSKEAIYTSFIYLITYNIALFGCFCCFYGIKQNGDYQKDINNIQGIAHYNPFIIGCFMIFLISLAGIPPIIGFNARISMINYFVANNNYIIICAMVIAIMTLIYAYLKIIKAFYFLTQPQKKYDRVDFGVYLVLFFYMAFIFSCIIHPTYVSNYIEEVLSKL